MRTAVLWGLLALLCQHMLVSSHTLGRASSTSDLAQLKKEKHGWRLLQPSDSSVWNKTEVHGAACDEERCRRALTWSYYVLSFRDERFQHSPSLLERFEETLAEVTQEDISDADYEGRNQDQVSRGWSLNQEGDQEISDRSQPPPAEDRSRAMSQRSRLQDLLMTTRKRASSCFGARMDRIGNASGLGCNNGRG